MAKKNKDQEPVANLNSVANRDMIQRINFLYQASTYLSSISQPPSEENPPKAQRKGKKRKKNAIRHPKNTAELSRAYVGSMRIVGQKTMVRMDPSIKRTLCKQCDTILIPGSTARVRVRPLVSHGEAVVYTCLTCNTARRIPAPPVLDVSTPPGPPAASSSNVSISTSTDSSAMDVDQQGTYRFKRRNRKRQSKNSNPRARIPPLFEREGHVIFRGNEKLAEDL